MYGLVLPSGADAAEALAIMVAGSNEEFAKLMNEKFHGRGGGKPEMVQGSVTGNGEEIYNYFICNFS